MLTKKFFGKKRKITQPKTYKNNKINMPAKDLVFFLSNYERELYNKMALE